MIQASHDSHVVGWEQDFKFGLAPTSDTVIVHEAVPAKVVGAAFMSGRGGIPVFHIDLNGNIQAWSVVGPAAAHIPDGKIEDLNPCQSVVLCGPGVENPQYVSNLCRKAPHASVFVCPLIGPLAAFGHVAGTTLLKGLERPRMGLFHSPRPDSLDAQFIDFDEKLPDDGYGKMAHLVQSYTPVVNQMMQTPCFSPFYGRLLSYGRWWSEPVFLMRRIVAEKYFPHEPISIREYAASWMPVAV